MFNAKQIIEDYKSRRKNYPDTWLHDCRKEKNLEEVIVMAATARDKNSASSITPKP